MKKFILLIMAISFSMNLWAKDHMICKTPTEHKKFRVIGNHLVMIDNLSNQSRIPSNSKSFEISAVGSSVHKSFVHEGQTFSFHVENKATPSEVEDYLTISNLEGHKITFPLTCQL